MKCVKSDAGSRMRSTIGPTPPPWQKSAAKFWGSQKRSRCTHRASTWREPRRPWGHLGREPFDRKPNVYVYLISILCRLTVVMVPVGYMAKRVAKNSEWLKAPLVTDIFSVSGCVSDDFADYINYWKHNGYWFFDNPEVIQTVARDNSIDLGRMTLFYYEGHEEEFCGHNCNPVASGGKNGGHLQGDGVGAVDDHIVGELRDGPEPYGQHRDVLALSSDAGMSGQPVASPDNFSLASFGSGRVVSRDDPPNCIKVFRSLRRQPKRSTHPCVFSRSARRFRNVSTAASPSVDSPRSACAKPAAMWAATSWRCPSIQSSRSSC